MAGKSKGTWLIMAGKGLWYVSFEPKKPRAHARVTETFPNEREAKKFARARLVDTPNVSAGTLNPHLPKRTSPQRRCLNGSKNRMKLIWPKPANIGCGYQKLKLGRSGDEVRLGWQVT
jgi:hypothetical protein